MKSERRDPYYSAKFYIIHIKEVNDISYKYIA
jgi:hypothetical protein